MGLTQPLCRIDELPEGEARGFDPLDEGKDTMFVIRRGARVHAWRNACPHIDFARMAWKKDGFLNADRTRIECFAHGALFEIETGLCTQGPCLGKRLIPVKTELRDGQLWLTGPYAPGLRPGTGRKKRA